MGGLIREGGYFIFNQSKGGLLERRDLYEGGG